MFSRCMLLLYEGVANQTNALPLGNFEIPWLCLLKVLAFLAISMVVTSVYGIGTENS
jgi:hypothetical protein